MLKNTYNATQAHIPVMLAEMIKFLPIIENGLYLDCTFGAGGYSSAILNATNGKLFAIDRDPNVSIYANQLKQQYQQRFSFFESNFSNISTQFKDLKFNSIVLDLGVSSMQLDEAHRGFSFMHDGPLDMRMGSCGQSAADFINKADEEIIANIIYKYGDETQSRKIARKIILARNEEYINTTGKLRNIIHSSIGSRSGKIDSATKTFQAIRIYINDELFEIEKLLKNINKILALNGNLIIISFHSLEDRIIKHFFKDNSLKQKARSKYSNQIEELNNDSWLKILTKKPIIPSKTELIANPRARSAKLRVAQKIYELK
jgi:16S rRNA (cytosine1402-N4)-methyltransferase